MPNHVTNILSFNCTDEKFNEILNFVRSNENEERVFDFNKIIPMPKELHLEIDSKSYLGLKLYSDYINDYKPLGKGFDYYINTLDDKIKNRDDFNELWELGKTQYSNIQKYGFPHWYDWSIANWGTKWNAYDVYIDKTNHTIEFLSAWSSPHEVIDKLSEFFPDTEIYLCWADEFFRNTCGERLVKNGNVLESFYPETEKEEIEMYCKVHDLDVDEFKKEFIEDNSDDLNLSNEKKNKPKNKDKGMEI